MCLLLLAVCSGEGLTWPFISISARNHGTTQVRRRIRANCIGLAGFEVITPVTREVRFLGKYSTVIRFF